MEHTIHISTSIAAEDFSDSIEVRYPCDYSCSNGIHRLKYDDEQSGFTVVKILPDGTIEINRRNAFPIVYRKDIPYSAEYQSEFGAIPMTFVLLEAAHSLSENGGRLEFTAEVTVDGEPQINKTTMLLIPNERNENIQ